MSHWEADPDALYTYLIEDNSLNNDARYTHYMVSNIPGSNMEYGEDVFCYIPSFSFFRPEQEDGSLGDSFEFKVGQHHEHLHLVYRQNGPVDFQVRCAKNSLRGTGTSSRSDSHRCRERRQRQQI